MTILRSYRDESLDSKIHSVVSRTCYSYDEPQLSKNVAKIGSPHRERDYRFSPDRITPKVTINYYCCLSARDAFPIPLRSFIYDEPS